MELFACVANRALEHQECAICCESLCSQQVSGLCNIHNKRVCRHTFHSVCLASMPNRSCPLCRLPFVRTQVMPNAFEQPREWYNFVDVDGDGKLSMPEILEALKSQLPVAWVQIERDAEKLWSLWDKNGDNSISYEEFSDQRLGIIAYLRDHYPGATVRPIPDINIDKAEWFRYWDEDNSGTLDKSEVCRALIKTFNIPYHKHAQISESLDCIWCIFDSDGNGTIDVDEFCQVGGLGETIMASIALDKER